MLTCALSVKSMKDVSSYRERIDVFNLAPAQLATVCVTCSVTCCEYASQSVSQGTESTGKQLRKHVRKSSIVIEIGTGKHSTRLVSYSIDRI